MKIASNNYYVVQGWMITELHLKGIDLQVYAILYGFTQDGETEFTGSQQYLCDFCGGVSRPTVANALKRLTEAGLIIKQTEPINGVIFNSYKVSLDYVKNLYMDGQNFLGGCKNSLQGGCKKILHNKERNINKEVIFKYICPTDEEFEQVWEIYPRKEGKKRASEAFAKARKKGVPLETILDGVKRYAAKVQAEQTETRFIKMGSTFFVGECWNDIYNLPSQPPDQVTDDHAGEMPVFTDGMSKQDRRKAMIQQRKKE